MDCLLPLAGERIGVLPPVLFDFNESINSDFLFPMQANEFFNGTSVGVKFISFQLRYLT